jgi:hypothetical protein
MVMDLMGLLKNSWHLPLVDFSDGGDLEELEQFQDYLSDNKFIVYDGLSPGRLIFSGNSSFG